METTHIENAYMEEGGGSYPRMRQAKGGAAGRTEGENRLPGFLRALVEGAERPLDASATIDCYPEWMDREKLRRGRAFASDHVFALIYSEMLALGLLLSFRGSLEPLVYTGKSSTPFTSHRRYLRTVLRVYSWYRSDPWERGSEAQRNLVEVRAMHASLANKMNEIPRSEITPRVTLEGKRLWCSAIEDIRMDLEESGIETAPEGCPFAAASSLRRGKASSGGVYVNQMDLSLTQFGFMGLVVLHPRMFGLGGSSEEDLDAFVHLWRALGHVLGVEDRYNFCSGDLDETRGRCRDVIEQWVKPNLLDVTAEWEHMYRCVVEGISYYVPANSFKAAVAYLCEVLEIPTPRLCASMGWRERLLLLAHRLVFRFLLRIPGVFSYYNRSIASALAKAQNASPEYLRKLREKRYRYMGGI